MLRTKSELIGEGSGFNVWSEGRVLGDVLYALTVIIDRMMKVFKALNVILFGDDAFHGVLL
jgi:hypothetical protein